MVVTNLMLCNVLYPLPTSRHLGSRPNNHYSRWRRRRFHPIDRPTRSTNVGAVKSQQDLAGSFILLIPAGATKSANWEGECGGVVRPCLDIDRFRSAAFTPKAVSGCDVACWVLNVSLREGTLWVFVIKRAWAVLAIFTTLYFRPLGFRPGLLGTRGYQWCFSFPALDMTILGTAVYFEEQVERERGLFHLVCVCCARLLLRRDLVDTPADL